MTDQSSAAVQWRGDLESNSLGQWAAVQEKDPSRVSIVSSVGGGSPRQGAFAARYQVLAGDNNVAGSHNGERAESMITAATTGAGEGVEQWWAWSTYFASDFQSGSGMWNFFSQFHHTGDTGQSNVEFSVADQSSLVMITNSGDPANPQERDFTIAPFSRGRWYDFVFHVKWSSNASVGFVEMFVNGAQVVSRTSLATLYPGQSVYFKQGFYRDACSCTSTVYHDGTRRADSYADAIADFPSGAWAGASGSPAPAPGTGPSPSPAPPASTPAGPSTSSGSTAGNGSTSSNGNSSNGNSSSGSSGSSSNSSSSSSNNATAAAAKGPHWGGKTFTSAETLRRTLASSSTSWEAFLRLHAGVAADFGLKAVNYGERFYTKQALQRWLAARQQPYRSWAASHVAAATLLASQPADTPVSDRMLVRVVRGRTPQTLRVVAHAFPAGRARLVVKASNSRRLASVTGIAEPDGTLRAVVRLNEATGGRRLVVAVTSAYPEGPRTARATLSADRQIAVAAVR